MPASFTIYVPRSIFSGREVITISPTTSELFINFNVYSDPELTNQVGQLFSDTMIHAWSGNVTTYNTTFIKFSSNSGLPNGDDNILVGNLTTNNKFTSGSGLANGTYYQQSNTFLSTGEWSGQTGYATITRDSTKTYDKVDVQFPIPVVTYTNAFNSLPQPNTAPLPN